MKFIILLLPIVFTTACTSNDLKIQCPPDKNYRYINNVLINDYIEKFKNKEISSIYYDFSNFRIDDRSFKYDKNVFKFIEKKMKLKNEKDFSVFKIEAFDLKNAECTNIMKKDNFNCYKITNQENIESSYALIGSNYNNATHVKFINLKDNSIIYEYSYTIYLTNAIGGAGYGMCPPRKEDNNLNKQINLIGFPSNPLNRPYNIHVNK